MPNLFRKPKLTDRQINHQVRCLIGEQIRDAKQAAIAHDFPAALGQELISLVLSADIGGWLNTAKFQVMELQVFAAHIGSVSGGNEVYERVKAFRVQIQAIRAAYVPKFKALSDQI